MTMSYKGTASVAQAKEVRAKAIAMMANMAVKAQFDHYISVAKDALYFTYMTYEAPADYSDVALDLQRADNVHLQELNISQYYHAAGYLPTEEYLSFYIDMLNQVISVDSPYMNLTARRTLANNLRDIKSYNADPSKFLWVQKPVKISSLEAVQIADAYASEDEGYYFGVGAAAVEFDRILNRSVRDRNGKFLYCRTV
jgi:hypothetical protein